MTKKKEIENSVLVDVQKEIDLAIENGDKTVEISLDSGMFSLSENISIPDGMKVIIKGNGNENTTLTGKSNFSLDVSSILSIEDLHLGNSSGIDITSNFDSDEHGESTINISNVTQASYADYFQCIPVNNISINNSYIPNLYIGPALGNVSIDQSTIEILDNVGKASVTGSTVSYLSNFSVGDVDLTECNVKELSNTGNLCATNTLIGELQVVRVDYDYVSNTLLTECCLGEYQNLGNVGAGSRITAQGCTCNGIDFNFEEESPDQIHLFILKDKSYNKKEYYGTFESAIEEAQKNDYSRIGIQLNDDNPSINISNQIEVPSGLRLMIDGLDVTDGASLTFDENSGFILSNDSEICIRGCSISTPDSGAVVVEGGQKSIISMMGVKLDRGTSIASNGGNVNIADSIVEGEIKITDGDILLNGVTYSSSLSKKPNNTGLLQLYANNTECNICRSQLGLLEGKDSNIYIYSSGIIDMKVDDSITTIGNSSVPSFKQNGELSYSKMRETNTYSLSVNGGNCDLKRGDMPSNVNVSGSDTKVVLYNLLSTSDIVISVNSPGAQINAYDCAFKRATIIVHRSPDSDTYTTYNVPEGTGSFTVSSEGFSSKTGNERPAEEKSEHASVGR